MWGERVKDLLAKCRLSKGELAQVLGVARQAVLFWLKDRCAPRMETVRKMERLDAIWSLAEAAGRTGPEDLRGFLEDPSSLPTVTPLTFAPRPVGCRAELPIYHLGDIQTPGARPLTLWLGVAAGTPRTPEAKDEPVFVQHAPGDSMAVRVTGDSMVDTLRDGDVVVVRPVCGRGLRLPPGRETPLAQVKAVVPEGAIALIELDGEPPTIKRVKYQAHGRRWYMMLCADNGTAAPGYPRVVDKADDCRIVGLVIGRVEK